jgi:phosphatidylinositol glycan class B
MMVAPGAGAPQQRALSALPPSRRALWAIVAAGAAARLLAFALRPALHPDEYFQYIEPAWQHLNGYGWPAWEWSVGLRSWVLPGFHGACLQLLDWLGLGDGPRAVRALQLLWALLSAAMIPAAHRAGQQLAGQSGGLLAAALCALLPELAYFAPHTLTEVPSALFVTYGFALWMEARAGDARERKAALGAGALLSLAICLRLPNAPLVLVPVFDLLWRRRWLTLGALALGALGPLLCFGAVDWLTWGRPFHSMIAYLDYNFLQGRAAEHGSSPGREYLDRFFALGGAPLLLVIALRLRTAWPAALPALLLLAALSTQAHKEERFLLAAWPLFAIAAGAALARLVEREQRTRNARWAWPAALALLALILGLNLRGVLAMPVQDYSSRSGLYDAQAWVGAQEDATGLLVEGRFHLSGGFATLSRNLPLESFHPALLENPIFSHAAVRDGSAEALTCAGRGFARVWSGGGFSVWRRRPR